MLCSRCSKPILGDEPMHDPGTVTGPDGFPQHRVHCDKCWRASVEILKSIGKKPPTPDEYWNKPTPGASIDNSPWTSKVRPYWVEADDDEESGDDE